jgi:prokaryotic ubiquitin-like protein Pup
MASTDGGGQQRASKRHGSADEVDEVVADEAQSDVQERHEKLADDVDALLDDIDEVLEENAEEFVRGYIQKGGQ